MSINGKAGPRAPATRRGRPRNRRRSSKQQSRPVVTTSPSRKVGEVNKSWFQKQPIEHESGLEKAFIHSALLCPGVVQITSQPATLELRSGTYTPDFELTLQSGPNLVAEIRPAANVRRDATKFNEAAELLSRHGKIFYVVTDDNIHLHDRPRTAKQVLRYGKSELAAADLDKVRQCLVEARALRCEEIVARTQTSLEHVLFLLARRELVVCDEGEVDGLTRVRLAPDVIPQTAFEERFGAAPWQFVEPCADAHPKRKGLKKRPKPASPYVTLPPIQPAGATSNSLEVGLHQPITPEREPYVIRKAAELARNASGSTP
jgi:hypothetical protein